MVSVETAGETPGETLAVVPVSVVAGETSAVMVAVGVCSGGCGEFGVRLSWGGGGRRGSRRRLGAGFWLASAWLVLMTVLALLAPVLPISDPMQVGAGGPRVGPQEGFADGLFLGTDALGRDVFSRTVHGARISMSVGAFAIVFGMAVGGSLGVLAGYFRGRSDRIAVLFFNVMLSFPQLVLAILITATLDRSLLVVGLALGVIAVAPVGRLARSATLVYSERDFVAAARVLGASHWRIIVHELLPNVIIPLGSLALLGMALTIAAEGGLAFLGLSVDGDDAISWGKMIVDGSGLRDIQKAPNVVLAPIVAMFATVLALNYIGDRIRYRFDVRGSVL